MKPNSDTTIARSRVGRRSGPFIAFHLIALFAVFAVPFRWEWLLLLAGSYALRMFAITAGYHRYFSHRTYKTSRAAQFLMAFLGGTAVQKGALWWAAHHRLHHRRSDQENDLHSPLQQGFWWAHIGWILSPKNDPTEWEQIPDLAKYPELVFLNRYHWLPPTIFGTVLFLAGGWGAFIWGFLASTVLLWHGTFTINSLAHVYGSRRYTTTDTSRNNFWLALLTLGEGWHNNHHCYMSSTRQGFFWWELDVSYLILKSLSWIGVTRDLREPPLQLLESKRLSLGATDRMPRPALLARAR